MQLLHFCIAFCISCLFSGICASALCIHCGISQDTPTCMWVILFLNILRCNIILTVLKFDVWIQAYEVSDGRVSQVWLEGLFSWPGRNGWISWRAYVSAEQNSDTAEQWTSYLKSRSAAECWHPLVTHRYLGAAQHATLHYLYTAHRTAHSIYVSILVMK